MMEEFISGETPEMPDRYIRQISVARIGEEGQIKLKRGKVFIVGCGALGSMAAMQLAGAGVGKIGIADFDTIEISNLQRQFFFKSEEAGEKKCRVLERSIKELNPDVETEVVDGLINYKSANDIFGSYDFIIDATDNPDSKIMIGKISKALRIACCIGGVRDFGGQVITFLPSDNSFEDYFGDAEGAFLPCSLGGVIGPAAALCASVQASEALKYLTGAGELLSGRLLVFDLLKPKFQIFSVQD